MTILYVVILALFGPYNRYIPRAGVGSLRQACQMWHAERFSMARRVN